MPAFSRKNIIKALSLLGLKNTLVSLRHGDIYSINRLSIEHGEIKLKEIGSVTDPKPLTIGRVGMPDPQLGITWNRSMTFYGAWFDDLGLSDTNYRIRNSILSLSKEKVLGQVQRDNKYGLIGTYYSVFLRVLRHGKGLPLVLLDDTLLGLGSFPVIIPKFAEVKEEAAFCTGLRLSLSKEPKQASEPKAEQGPEGLTVEELSEADRAKYFSA